MNSLTRTLAVAAIACSALALPAAHAREDSDADKFVKMCDMDKDGMVSKAEMMKHMETMFDKMDKNKDGKLTADEWMGKPKRDTP